jgi:CubicO group peptidase (beta-lactamase class C family)
MTLLALGLTLIAAEVQPADLNDLLAPIRERHNLPAMAAAVTSRDALMAIGAVGVRQVGSDVPVTIDDKFHFGSCTKAMTATLVARLVEQGKLQWTTTMAEAFPTLADGMQPSYRAMNLDQLLSQHGGLPGTNPHPFRVGGPGEPPPNIHELRLRFVAQALAAEPIAPPGQEFQYTNDAYIIAGTIAEQVTGETWEALMRREVFEPLGMRGMGFGPMATGGQVDQPWSHAIQDGKCEPVPDLDNPRILGPAGRCHGPMADWARFVAAHLNGVHEENGYLSTATFEHLHRPPCGGEYAFGWMAVERGWAQTIALTHAGSNNLNFCVVWASPARGFGVLVATNAGGGDVGTACDEVASQLVGWAVERL